MKKIFKSLALIAVAAMTLIACQKEVAPQQKNADGLYEYSFTILEDGTKAEITDNCVNWVSGDRVGMFVGDYKGYANVNADQNPKTVKIYSNSAIAPGTEAYSYFPYDNSNESALPSAAKITLSNIQNGAGSSAMPLAGIPFEVVSGIEIPDGSTSASTNGQIQFLNLGSLINFKIFSTNEEFQNETITSVKFESTKRIAGSGILDLTAVDMNEEGTLEIDFSDGEEILFVKVEQEVPVAADKEDATPIRMVILPGTFEGILTVTTDVATYTKEMPEREYLRSGSRTWGLDLNKAEREEGVQETVVTLPYSEAFTTNQGDFKIDNVQLPEGHSSIWTFDASYGAKVTAHIGNDDYVSETWLVSPWLNLTEVADAAFNFDHAGRYFSDKTKESTVWAKSDEEGAEWVKLSIPTYFSNNNWTFVNSGEISLSDYVGKKVKIAFKYTSTTTAAGTWEIKNFNAHVVKLDAGIAYESETWKINLGADDYDAQELTNPHELTVTYSSSNEDIVVVDEETGEIVIGDEAGSAVITATFAGNDTYNEATASYTIYVVDPTSVPDPETIVFANLNLTNSVQYSSFNGGNFTISFGDGDNDGKYYTTGSGIRTYANGHITVESAYDIVRIEYTFASGYAPTSVNYSVNVGTLTPGATTVWTGSAKSIVLTDTGTSHWRLQSVKVYYTEPVISVYEISIGTTTNGTVTASAEEAEEGTEITLTVTPATGYKLETLVVNDVDVADKVVNGQYAFSMPAEDVSISATFVIIPAGETTYTVTWNTTNNSASIGDYINEWYVTADGFRCDMTNWNNNQNGWNYVKAGRKNNASTATITTHAAISEAIKTVRLTIDAVTASKINSLKLYVSSSNDFTNATSYNFTVATGEQSVTIATPTTNCYYMIEADCASGSSNGLITVSKLIFTTN